MDSGSLTLDNPLPGVPKVESPFFEEFFGKQQVDAETYRIASSLNQRGFAIIDFPDPDVLGASDHIKASLRDLYDWDRWRTGQDDGLRIQDAWRFEADVRRLAVNEVIIELLSTLYGRRAFPFQTLNFPVGTQQHFHTDSVHFSSMPERFMCGVWLALEDIDEGAGPLVYYPGSHKWPVFTNEHIGYSATVVGGGAQEPYHPAWEKLVETFRVVPERLTIRAGQALIWAANLLHGGDRQRNKEKTRWSQVTHYYFDDCSYYSPMQSDLPLGRIAFKEPFDIAKNQQKSNFYLGMKVPRDFIIRTSPEWSEVMEGFHAADYLAANPDVAVAGADPAGHYFLFGRGEGRRLKP